MAKKQIQRTTANAIGEFFLSKIKSLLKKTIAVRWPFAGANKSFQ